MRRTATRLVGIVLALLCIGVVMLYSTSAARASACDNDAQYYVKRQLLWLCFAALCGLAVFRIDYHVWRRLAIPLCVGAAVLLTLVFVPKIGVKGNGAFRWIGYGGFRMQPSELARFAVVVGMSAWITRVGPHITNAWRGCVYPMGGLSVLLGLVLVEPDFGTTLLLGVVGMTLLFVGGTRLPHLLCAALLLCAAFSVAVWLDPRRFKLVWAVFDPDSFPQVKHHLDQAHIAFARGGWFGVGFLDSQQKHFYLPEAHTDFILPIIGEELGLVGTLLVLLLFGGLGICGFRISRAAPDAFGRLLGFGFAFLLSAQAAINFGVVMGRLPAKGLPLPFISYGGSSLMMSMVSVCVLLNIASHVVREKGDRHTRPVKDRFRAPSIQALPAPTLPGVPLLTPPRR